MTESRKVMRRRMWEWGYATRRIDELERERADLARRADDARETRHAQVISDMPRGGGRKTDLCDVVERVIDLEAKYREGAKDIDARIAATIDRKIEIDRLVDELDPFQQRVLTARYKDGGTWIYISLTLNCDESTARRNEERAVDMLAAKLGIS